MKFYQDRMPIKQLAECDPSVLHLLLQQGKGKIDSKKHVHFCGLITSAEQEPVFFRPLGTTASLPSAKATMQCLALYGREIKNRSVGDSLDTGSTGLLATIAKIASDFRSYGIYSERIKVTGQGSGKPDWPSTIRHQYPLPSKSKKVVYPNIQTISSIDSREVFLGQVHAQILLEIMHNHGWWIDGLQARHQELRTSTKPAQPRRLWPKMLADLQRQVFSTRGIHLIRLLIDYLNDFRAEKTGTYVFGIEDFHVVWERMLYRVVPNVIEGINAKLPFARYLPNMLASQPSAPVNRHMRTDTIARTKDGYLLLDAKYYEGQSADTLPGWADIAKQFIYEQALRQIVEKNANILNAFVFPSTASPEGQYQQVNMYPPDTSKAADAFPNLQILYADIMRVMQAYLSNQKIPHIFNNSPQKIIEKD